MKLAYPAIPLSIIALLLAASVGCQQKQSSPKAYIQITDSSMAGSQYFLVNSYDYQNYQSYYQIMDTAQADSNGTASFSFEVDSNAFFAVLNDRKYKAIHDIVIGPGDTLIYDKDNGNYSGTIANQIEYQTTIRDSFFAASNSRKDSESMAWPYDSFHSYITSKRNELDNFLDSFSSEFALNTQFHNYQKHYNKTWFGNQIAGYLGYHNYYATGKFGRIPADSLGFKYEPYISDPTYRFNPYYMDIIENYVDEQYYLSANDLPDSIKYKNSFQKRVDIIKSQLDGINQDIAFAKLASRFSHFINKDNFFDQADSALAFLEKNKSNEIYIDYFRNKLNGYRSIAPGKPAPPLAFPDTSGSLVALSDFRGKVVYLDFWGTWCGPCISSIPKLKTLFDTFATNDDNVVFLNIAMEGGENYVQNWKDFLSDRDYYRDNVVHLVCEEQFNNDKLDPYLINAAPTYMLIDQEGKIVKTRGPYPTQAKEEIRKLLKEES